MAMDPDILHNQDPGPNSSEAIRLMQEGVDPKKMDKLSKGAGLPVVLLLNIDEAGIDVAAHVAEDLQAAFWREVWWW